VGAVRCICEGSWGCSGLGVLGVEVILFHNVDGRRPATPI
jgi:hypothetical protein